jgi:hypothetical protein
MSSNTHTAHREASIEFLSMSYNNLEKKYDLEKEISKKMNEDNRIERSDYEIKNKLYLEVKFHYICDP